MPGTWKETGRNVVHPWLCDQFGHMNVRFFTEFFVDASFHVWTVNGVGVTRMEERGVFTVVANMSFDFLREVTAGQMLVIRSAFIGVGNTSATYLQRMYDADHGTLHATNTGVEVFFNPNTREKAAMPDWFRERLLACVVDPDSE